jgi:ATP-binding cassette subfamily B protein
MRYFVRVLAYLRPFWKRAAGSIAITIAISLLALAAPWPLKVLFDHVISSHPLPPLLEPILGGVQDRKLLLLPLIVAAGLGITLAQNGLSVVNSYVQTSLEQGMVLNFRSDLFQHAQKLSMAFHDRRRSGGLIFAIRPPGLSWRCGRSPRAL